MSRYSTLLRDKNSINLFLGSLFANFGQAMATITIIWTVYAKTNNPFFIAISLLCLELPAIVFGPFLGNLLDKYKIKTMINYSNLFRGLLFVLLIIFPLINTINYIIFFGLIVISSTLVPIARSGENILVGKITDKDNRLLVNSLMNIIFDLSNIFGSLAGGLVLAIGIGNKVFFINGILFFLSSIFIFLIKEKEILRTQNEKVSSKNRIERWITEFREGIKYTFSNKVVLSLISVSFFWNFLIWGTAPTLIPIFSSNIINSGANGYGILNAASSLGIIIGSFLSGIKLPKIKPLTIVFLSVGFHGLFYGIFAFSYNLVMGSTILAIAGIISAPAMIYNRTILQNTVPEDIQGRVFTVIATLGTLGFPLGTVIGATYLGFSGEYKVTYLFLVSGLFVFIFCIILSLLWRGKNINSGNAKSSICKEDKSLQSKA